jgi:hypothetical protein
VVLVMAAQNLAAALGARRAHQQQRQECCQHDPDPAEPGMLCSTHLCVGGRTGGRHGGACVSAGASAWATWEAMLAASSLPIATGRMAG